MYKRSSNNNKISEGEEPCCDVVLSIAQMLGQPTVVPEECSIYRVPKRLLNIRPMAYTPQLISIGPLHHGRQDLMAMEQLKLQCFHNYLSRINRRTEDIVIIALSYWKDWEKNARDCYAEPINMGRKDFVKMMLVDGCFIIELMIHDDVKFPSPAHKLVDFSFFKSMSIDLYRDLTMLENQLPFFVLENLFELIIPQPGEREISFAEVTHRFFKKPLALCEFPPNVSSQTSPKHLVDFLSFYTFRPLEPRRNHAKLMLPPTATELFEAGVRFKKLAPPNKGIMDIRFENGDLWIPPFKIHDPFEAYMRNLMAFEHFPAGNDRFAIHYVAFLDGLITTERDVSLLVKADIITNHIGGSDEEVSVLFNDLCKEIIIDGGFYFHNLSKDLHERCKKRRYRWVASLRRDYFHTPWAYISFVAATFLILLTLLQTIFSGRALHQ